jgi:hypothetical protein
VISFKIFWNIDRRIYYTLLFILVSALLLFPVGMPLQISPEVRETWQMIDDLEPGDFVIINFCLSASGYAQLQGAVNSMIAHIFEKPGVTVMFMMVSDQAPIMLEEIITINGDLMPGETTFPWYEIRGKTYGDDYINMGFYPGISNFIAALSMNFRESLGDADWYGVDVTGFFDSHNIQSAEDVDLVVSFDSDDGAGDFMRYFFLEYGTPVIQSMIGVMVANSKVQYNAGNYAGIVPSIRGSAEYQYLQNYPGMALTQMDAFSVVQFYLMALMIVGNLGYHLYGKKQQEAT